MLTEQDKRMIRSRLRAIEKTESKLKDQRWNLRGVLALIQNRSGATLSELGEVVGVSRQRIHQILKGE